jgi:ATP-dependent RNA helicase RhlE
VTHSVYQVDKSDKNDILSYLITNGAWEQVLVFTRTKHGANKLAQYLERDGISSAAIHGNKSQGARTRALADFKAGAVRVLVATDIAARGLDIEQLPHVVNYELPNVPEDYVHRIGRTGRAGASGDAISLVSPEERKLLVDIERLLKRKIDVLPVPYFEPGEQPRQNAPRKPQQNRNNRPRTGAESTGNRPGGNGRASGSNRPAGEGRASGAGRSNGEGRSSGAGRSNSSARPAGGNSTAGGQGGGHNANSARAGNRAAGEANGNTTQSFKPSGNSSRPRRPRPNLGQN